jgi:hypothetical protein
LAAEGPTCCNDRRCRCLLIRRLHRGNSRRLLPFRTPSAGRSNSPPPKAQFLANWEKCGGDSSPGRASVFPRRPGPASANISRRHAGPNLQFRPRLDATCPQKRVGTESSRARSAAGIPWEGHVPALAPRLTRSPVSAHRQQGQACDYVPRGHGNIIQEAVGVALRSHPSGYPSRYFVFG